MPGSAGSRIWLRGRVGKGESSGHVVHAQAAQAADARCPQADGKVYNAAMRTLRRWLHYLVPLLVLVLALGVRSFVPAVEEAQLKVFDGFQRLKPRRYEPVPVKYIDLDDESLDKIGQWPWPRTFVADLTARLHDMGAAAIVFDIVFAEPDRTSPANILQIWPNTPEIETLRGVARSLPDHDEVLAEVFAQANVVTGFVLTDAPGGRTPALKGSFAMAGDDPKPFLPTYRGAVTNLPGLEKASAGNGSFNLVPETDGMVRRVPLLVRIGDRVYPTLAAEAVRVAQGARTFVVKSSGASGETAFGEHTGLISVKIGDFAVPTDANGRIWLHDTGIVAARRIPAWKIAAGEVDRAEIEGHIVVFGTSAAGLMDLRSTPLSSALPGVEVHIQAIEQILLGHFLQRPDWAFGAEIIYLLTLGLALIILIPLLGAMWCTVIGLAGVGAALAASWYLYANHLWLLDPVLPSLVVLLIYMSSSLINYLKSEAERRQVRGAFSRYMSPALVSQLVRDPSRLVLGGEMKDMTLLFCDIRGFTAISEQFKTDPQGLTRLINRFLTPMTDMILQRGGTIDKYMGDCIMAFWNAPLDDQEHARHGCESALAMMSGVIALNEQMKAEAEADGRPFYAINVGIGLNSGDCCVGNMGSTQRFDYSVLGDAVNLAARLEGQSKNYGVGIVIGHETSKRAAEFAVIELDFIAVKGKQEGVRIFGLLGDEAMREDPEFAGLAERHDAMLRAYRDQQWQRARQLLSECRSLDGSLDVLYDLYEERLELYEKDPPGPDWDGVYVATSK